VSRVVFLGTGGARYVVFQQVRASGGMWMELDGTKILVDPGPGSLVKMRAKKQKLDPRDLDAVALSHAHLDHSGDLNIVIEAMTGGGFRKKGLILLPKQALEEPGIVLDYLKGCVDRILTMREGGRYSIGNVELETPLRHIHGVETYGINFRFRGMTLSYIADSRYTDRLPKVYAGDILIINVVRTKPSNLDHLCLDDVKAIVSLVRPRLAVLTHFGMTVIRAKPWVVAEEMAQETGVNVIAARDGMSIELDQLSSGQERS
jgi:ribonuclease BN (tRNA processing enzyme)